MISFFFHGYLCLKVLWLWSHTHCLAVFSSRFILTYAKITRWWSHRSTWVLLQGKEFFAAQQDAEISHESKQIPKTLKVSQKPGTAVIGVMFISMKLSQGRERIMLGTPVLQFSLHSWDRAVLTWVLFRGVRLEMHIDPLCNHF